MVEVAWKDRYHHLWADLFMLFIEWTFCAKYKSYHTFLKDLNRAFLWICL